MTNHLTLLVLGCNLLTTTILLISNVAETVFSPSVRLLSNSKTKTLTTKLLIFHIAVVKLSVTQLSKHLLSTTVYFQAVFAAPI